MPTGPARRVGAKRACGLRNRHTLHARTAFFGQVTASNNPGVSDISWNVVKSTARALRWLLNDIALLFLKTRLQVEIIILFVIPHFKWGISVMIA